MGKGLMYTQYPMCVSSLERMLQNYEGGSVEEMSEQISHGLSDPSKWILNLLAGNKPWMPTFSNFDHSPEVREGIICYSTD